MNERGECFNTRRILKTNAYMEQLVMSDHSTKSIEYRELNEFPDYRIGDDGTVWSMKKRCPNSPTPTEWRELKKCKNKYGYLSVVLQKNGIRHRMMVHHLVLIAFGFARPSISHVTRHMNGISDDNRLSNLKWGTNQENSLDMVAHGKSLLGETNHNAKLTAEDIHKIRYVFMDLTIAAVGKMFGVTDVAISCVRLRKTWKHLP